MLVESLLRLMEGGWGGRVIANGLLPRHPEARDHGRPLWQCI
jgi:hypothetical protein